VWQRERPNGRSDGGVGGSGARAAGARGELIERSFAHRYETGGMRHCHPRGWQNILKRQLIQVGAFQPESDSAKAAGHGHAARELNNRAGETTGRLLRFLLRLMALLSPAQRLIAAVGQPDISSFRCRMPRHPSRNISSSSTGCY
jgi:hypothetical protein